MRPDLEELSQAADLSPSEKSLLTGISDLQEKLRAYTKKKFSRMNPFYEDLFSWKERGEFATGRKSDVTIYNSATVIGEVQIGDRTWVGPFCLLDGSGGLAIGENCSISAGVQILSHDTVKWALSNSVEQYERSPVKIGKCCFLGTNSVITRGVNIGDHCLIAAGAVVIKDVAPYSIMAGVPARTIGTVEMQADGKVQLKYDLNEKQETV